MLPSTGYFKAINCPFYENGYCERPYCHFKHSRRDGASTSTTVTSEQSQTIQKPQDASTATVATANPKVIEQLVSEAVKKVLADQNVTDTENIVNKVVAGLKPNLVSTVLSNAQATKNQDGKSTDHPATSLSVPIAPLGKSSSCFYNPTPINELKKRHIPVPAYEMTRESKAVKRKSPDADSPWMDVIRNINIIKEPKRHKVRYKPTAISQLNAAKESPIHSYGSAPYDISSGGNNVYVRERRRKKEFYQPKPKKRREEYVPRKPKVPLKHDQSLEDDSYDLDDDVDCESDSNTSAVIDDESQDLVEIDPNYSDDESISVIATASVTKEKENLQAVNTKTLFNEKENKTTKNQDDSSSQNNNKNTEKLLTNEDLRKNNEDVSKNQNKTEKSSKDDSKPSKVESKSCKNESRSNKDESKSSKEDSSKNKDKGKEDFKPIKIKEEPDWKNVKIKEEPRDDLKVGDSKHSKSKDKDRGDQKKDKDKDKDDKRDKNKDKDKEKSKEKDKHKHSSKSSDKERSSSSSSSLSKDKSKDKDRDKDREKDKDKKDISSHKIKKEIKVEKDSRSSSRDSKDSNRDSKEREKSKHKSDDKSSSHKSKSSSSDSKGKSTKHSSKDLEHRSSHSSHKSDKSREKVSMEKEIKEEPNSDSDKSDESDHEEKCDSPEYEEFSPMYDEHLLEDSDSDHDVEAECRKIFQEYKVTDCPKEVIGKADKPEVVEIEDDPSKKRVAHAGAAGNLTKQVGPSQPLKRLPNPQQRMYERWRMMREVAAEKAAEKAAASRAAEVFLKKAENSDHQVNGNGRIRIAQVPYAMSLALEKKKVLELAAKIESKTVAQTKKGVSRVAHIPQTVPQLIRPEPMQNAGTPKFPLNVRQFYVNAMQDICTQIYTNSDDAAQRAVREELACYEKCKTLNVYKNSCMLTVHRLRKEVDQSTTEEVSASYSGLISHEAVLAGKVKGSYSVIKTKKLSDIEIRGVSLYKMLTKWIMSEQELKDNGYPRQHPDGPKGRAKLYITNTRGQSTLSKVPNQRYCCRCNKPYMVDKHGFPVRKENCIYHYARKYTFRGESKYMCCKQDASSDGCCDASTHVWDYVDVENLRGYVCTLDKDVSAEKQGIYALDCEMCYTTQGLELTRVTVINEKLEVVYEALVKPENSIIDYNTRFSGISENDMKNVTTTLIEVQATLLSIFSSKTILIGHSLESDFKALKLIHNTVVDTSVMFPHKNGPPFKRALKNLCSEYLRKIIQNDVGGHDSKEDALACMELVLWKVKEETKLQ